MATSTPVSQVVGMVIMGNARRVPRRRNTRRAVRAIRTDMECYDDWILVTRETMAHAQGLTTGT